MAFGHKAGSTAKQGQGHEPCRAKRVLARRSLHVHEATRKQDSKSCASHKFAQRNSSRRRAMQLGKTTEQSLGMRGNLLYATFIAIVELVKAWRGSVCERFSTTVSNIHIRLQR